MKTKMQLTFTGLDADLLDRATVCAAFHADDDPPTNATRRWFVFWAVRAVARAVIAAQKMPCPLAVQMRLEFDEESRARGELLTASEAELPDTPSAQLVVLCEALQQRAHDLGALIQSRAENTGYVPFGNRFN